MSILERMPASWQAAIALLAQPVLKKIGVEYDMNRVYRECGVGRTSAFEAARLFSRAIETPNGKLKEARDKNRELDQTLRLTKFHNDVLRFLPEHPGAWIRGEERHQFSDEFKIFLLAKKKEYDLEWGEIGQRLDIPEETLKKFKHQVETKGSGDDDDNGGPTLRDLPEVFVETLRAFFQGRESKATVKDFAEKHPEILKSLEMGYKEFANLLLRLGFVSPKGIFLNNTGLDKIVRFKPQVIWGTDGKQMKVIINGEIFHFVWQCLIDYKSTVLVGGLVREAETTVNLLNAIKAAKENYGLVTRPMAIVIDGRLSENLPAIRAYLDEMGIEIIRTFPGNPKSNGITEGNFNIFEKWVGGQVTINGETAEEVALSIAKMLTEVFTQLRNNQPRKGLGQKTANEALAQAAKLTAEEEQTIRAKISALANRFKNEQAVPIVSARKQEAINQAIDLLCPPDIDTFRKRLAAGMFTMDLILDALAIFKKQREKYPEKTFDHTYFGGILRNLVDQRSVEMLHTELEKVYSEHWARMTAAMNEGRVQAETTDAMCERLSQEYLKSVIPAHGWLTLSHLQSAFLLAAGGSVAMAEQLRQRLTALVNKSRLECADKRKRLLRKIYVCESFVKQMKMAAEWKNLVATSSSYQAL